MKGKRDRKKIADLKRRPMRQNSGTPEELKALALSWLERAAHDIIITPSLIVVDGHRRLEGLEQLGETEADVFVTDEELDENEIRQVGLTTAIHRADLSGYDKWQACKELLELNPDWQLKDLAQQLHLDPSSVTRLLSPSKCSLGWQEALRDGKVGISDCYAASKLAPDDQPGLLAMKLGGASRNDIERQGRKTRSVSAKSVSVPSIKIALVNDISVVIKAESIDLEQGIEVLKDAIKAMTKARDTGLNASTAQKVWRDMAAAGA